MRVAIERASSGSSIGLERPVARGRANTLIALYDRLDRHLKATLKAPLHEGFARVVGRAADAGLLTPEERRVCDLAAQIRNIIVHEGTSDGRVVVPTAEMLRRFETVLVAIKRPRLAIPMFERTVEVVQFNEPLSSVLKRISRRDYTQFPVYRSGRFHGLLTENGITRWLAHHVTGKASVVSVDVTRAGDLLACEESDPGAAEFAPRDEVIGAVALRFQQNALLEAALITKTGAKSEALLGIATRWDIARLPASLG
jgi:hypothetical protein